MPMLAAWNRSTLLEFANRLSAAVEQGPKGMVPMPQPIPAAASSIGRTASASEESRHAPAAEHSPDTVCDKHARPSSGTEEAARTAGATAKGTSPAEGREGLSESASAAAQHGRAAALPASTHQERSALPDLGPSTPGSRDTRALPATASPVAHGVMGTPGNSLRQVQAAPALPARQDVSGQTQSRAEPACEVMPCSAVCVGHSAAAQQALDSLHAWAELQAPGDPAVSLVLASAARTAASDLGLAAGVGPLPWPLYMIATRDSFSHHLHAHSTQARILQSGVALTVSLSI